MRYSLTFIVSVTVMLYVGLSFANAQNKTSDSVRLQKRAEQRAELMQTTSQFRFSVGFMPNFGGSGPGGPYTKSSPIYGLEYSYRVWNFLEVGASVSMIVLKQYESAATVSQSINSARITRRAVTMNLGLTVRYSWFNRRWISLYSSLGAWCEFTFYEPDASGRPSTYRGIVLPEVVPIGVRVGRRFFGFIEPLCFSGRGMLLQGGVGYKF